MRKRKSGEQKSTTNSATVIAALITAMGAVIVGYWQFGRKSAPAVPDVPVSIRVIDRSTERPIRGADIAVTGAGIPLTKRTDSEGVFSFRVDSPTGQVRIRVTADGYGPYDRTVDRAAATVMEDILLMPVDPPSPDAGADTKPEETGPAESREPREPASVHSWRHLWQNESTIRVSFLDGPPSLHARVRRYAEEWTRYANIRFVFVTGAADVRVSFAQQGSWSMLGREALGVPQGQPTLNLGGITADSTEDAIAAAALHEFGHVLGLVNEHQNPNARIAWKQDLILRELEGQSRAVIEKEVFWQYSHDQLPSYRAFDPASVMMDRFPARWANGEFANTPRTTLSASDKRFVAQLYPK